MARIPTICKDGTQRVITNTNESHRLNNCQNIDNRDTEQDTCNSYTEELRQPAISTEIINDDDDVVPNFPNKSILLENGSIPLIKSRGIKFAHLNIHSLTSKNDELKLILKNSPFDVIALSETLCDNTIIDSEVCLDDFVLLRKDRNRHGGGVAVLISKRFDYKRRDDLCHQDLECLWVELHYPHKPPILIGAFYRPPNATTEFFDKLDSNLEMASSVNKSCILLGDFNCNYMPNQADSNTNKLDYCTKLYGFSQLINSPTRVTNSSSTIIDLIFVSDPELYREAGICHTSVSDHFFVYAVKSFNFIKGKNPTSVEFRSFKNFDQERFLDELRTMSWHVIKDIRNVDLAWKTWEHLLFKVVNKHIPLCHKRIRKNACPWITDDIVHLMKQRDHAHKVAILTKDDELWSTYKTLKNKVTHLIRKSKKEYHCNFIEENQGNSRNIWKCLKRVIPKSSKISPHSLEIDGAHISDPPEVANAFNNFFTTCAANLTKDLKSCRTESHIGDDIPYNHISQFDLDCVSEDFVIKEIDRMCNDKATGDDHISCRLLKLTKHVIAGSLTDMINMSLTTGFVPKGWKEARVIPIFKAGDMSNPSNYRPISILSVVSKIIERAVHRQLSEYIDDNNILNSSQSGFRAKHSTSTALMKFVNNLSWNIENRQISGVAFIDLRKAFDTVDHNLLLGKLSAIGCSHECVEWFRSYLTDREQTVHFKGSKSHPLTVLMGVPQGSILGPLLFSIYVNTLPNCITDGYVDMYADDTTLTVSGNSVAEVEQKLSFALEELMVWINQNRLVLNTEKTCVMVIASRANLKKITSFNVSINGKVLKRVNVAKCLGILIDEELNWSKHVDKVTKVTQRNVSIIKRAKDYLPFSSLKMLYNALVLPHFDYCSSVWSNRYQEQTYKLQKVQKRAARIISNKGFETPSRELITNLKWMPIEKRFEFQRVTMMFKCTHDLAPSYLQGSLVKVSDIHQHQTRQADEGLLSVPKYKTECFKHSPLVSSIIAWNKLDRSLKTASSVNTFKYMFKRSCIVCSQ